MDVVDLRDFYESPLGASVKGLLLRVMRQRLQPKPNELVLGLGYANPLLDALVPEVAVSLSFMMARQGVIHWPLGENVRSALVDENDLPLLESMADHVVVVHGLEQAELPLDMLQEIWRVLAPQGKLYLVVPNRAGLWAASDASPFGSGQPFSRRQIANLLKEARFSATWWQEALVMPPVSRPSLLKAAPFVEQIGRRLSSRFSGVIVVEAVKQVYAFSSGKRARRMMPRFRPMLLPRPAGNSTAKEFEPPK
jgi:SAM-dependent methyltransferase